MQRGVVYGMLAGALWGMVFLVPHVLSDISPLLLSAGRYVMYGAVSLAVALPFARSLLARLTRQDLRALVVLALTGNLLYYILLTGAVQLIGVAPTSLIIGVLPVTVTLLGRRDAHAVPLRRLALPLSMVVAGIVCINIDVLPVGSHRTISVATWLGGIACATGALGCWSWFAVANSRYLQRHVHFNGNEWSVLWGVVTGALGVLLWLGIALLPAGIVQTTLSSERWQAFWLMNLVLAVGASWLGNGLWNAASKRLPLTLSGQLIVFETLFALLYGFMYDHRMPRPLEIAAIVLLMGGVSWSVRQHAGRDAERPGTQDSLPTPAH
ncbi:DMT family transporter [Paraburkholderia bonniea]|uniref:DMT family transporter n=1 Tax=Paraburkholderia bonniea TaxID=2152891 RepID=UPI00129114BC|nr:DMT family transporter [Paraburkholderia bonniea]WJF89192.1 DMT family transporter [Paraburkholderia bonniea]WJF92508.1 DMT family transporter [Paraburkholderia bonniea]